MSCARGGYGLGFGLGCSVDCLANRVAQASKHLLHTRKHRLEVGLELGDR